MKLTSITRWLAVLLIAGLAASCTTSRKTSTNAGDTGKSGSVPGGATAQGVTASTIKVGFSYIDLATLAKSGIIKVDHGPYAQIAKVLVDDINARGGINGRKLDLVTAKYSPIGNEEQLAACTKLTQDDKVFAVLDGLLGDNNLCITQQHATILVGQTGLNASRLAKARAPWATYQPSDERSVKALISLLDQSGRLKGKKIAVYSADPVNKPLLNLAVKSVQDAGYKVQDSALLDTTPGDTQAATAQDKVFAERFKNKGVDTVIVAGQFIPASDFDGADFHPSLYTLESGNVAAAAFTNPLGKFPIVAAPGGPPTTKDPAEFQRCKDVWKKATGKQITTAQEEDKAGKSTGFVAMTIACTDFQIFVAAAKAAGKNLTNETFNKGLESLGNIDLAAAEGASFGPAKHDGSNRFVLLKLDPTWKEGSGKLQFVPQGNPITLPN